MINFKSFLIGLCSLVSFCHSPYAPHQDDYVAPAGVLDRMANSAGAIWGRDTDREIKLENKLVDRRNELNAKIYELNQQRHELNIKSLELNLKSLEKQQVQQELAKTEQELTKTEQKLAILQKELQYYQEKEARRKAADEETEKAWAKIHEITSGYRVDHRKIKIGSERSSDSADQGVTQSSSAETSKKSSPESKSTTFSCPNCFHCISLPQSTANNGM